MRPIPESHLIRLDHDPVGAVDLLYPRRAISECRIVANTFGNLPITVMVSVVSNPYPAAAKAGFRVHLGQPRLTRERPES